MTDTPPPREQFLDSRWFVSAGGAVLAVMLLWGASLVRLRPAIDDAAWDRVAAALADAPPTSPLVVVRAAARTTDADLAQAVLRLDSAGATHVALAIDLSVPVPPSGRIAELPQRVSTTLFGATLSGDTVAWPWFLDDATHAALQRAGRLATAELLRDADGVVRRSVTREAQTFTFAERLGAALAHTTPGGAADSTRLLRFADPSSRWEGFSSVAFRDVVRLPLDSVRALVQGRTVLVGIVEGARVPTSVGALPALAIVAHDADARARVLARREQVIHPAPDAISWIWLLAWIATGAALTALTSWRVMLAGSVAGLIVQAALVVRFVDSHGLWLPLGSTVLAWLSASGAAAALAAWQVRRAQQFTAQLFSRFMTPALADAAWRSRHLYLDGGRPTPMLVPVTVLFLDLRGFTRFSEAADPAAVMALLTDVTSACAADIAAHGGLVDDFAGDGIKADFGVPVPRSSAAAIAADARQAVACAQVLATTLERLLPASLGTAGTQVRIGIHSGRAVAGTIGGASRLKYTVAGDVVNVAARLQSLDLATDAEAPARCRILLSQDTAALCGDMLPATHDEGLIALKGREHPIRVFRILSDTSR